MIGYCEWGEIQRDRCCWAVCRYHIRDRLDPKMENGALVLQWDQGSNVNVEGFQMGEEVTGVLLRIRYRPERWEQYRLRFDGSWRWLFLWPTERSDCGLGSILVC